MSNKFNNNILIFSAILMFVSNNIAVILIYTFITILFIISILKTAVNKKIKTVYIIGYVAMYLMQIGYVAVVNMLETKSIIEYSITNRFIFIFLLFITFIIEKKYRIENYDWFYIPFISDIGMITYSDLKILYEKRKNVKENLNKKIRILNKNNVKQLVTEINKTNSFKYINKKTLDKKYFKNAYDSLKDENIYLVISNTGTVASETLSLFTNKDFNHISIAFDSKLKTIVSYNGGENINLPGLNMERIEYFYKKKDSSILIYSLKVNKEAKLKMIKFIENINEEGSAYNFLGLPLNKSFKPNIMYCSQFVYKLLEKTDMLYFTKTSRNIKPTDFIELDYTRKLKFEEEIKLTDIDKNKT